MRALLRGGELPELVFAVNDVMALGALAAGREAGIRVPEDVALAGFDVISTRATSSPCSRPWVLPSTSGLRDRARARGGVRRAPPDARADAGRGARLDRPAATRSQTFGRVVRGRTPVAVVLQAEQCVAIRSRARSGSRAATAAGWSRARRTPASWRPCWRAGARAGLGWRPGEADDQRGETGSPDARATSSWKARSASTSRRGRGGAPPGRVRSRRGRRAGGRGSRPGRAAARPAAWSRGAGGRRGTRRRRPGARRRSRRGRAAARVERRHVGAVAVPRLEDAERPERLAAFAQEPRRRRGWRRALSRRAAASRPGARPSRIICLTPSTTSSERDTERIYAVTRSDASNGSPYTCGAVPSSTAARSSRPAGPPSSAGAPDVA